MAHSETTSGAARPPLGFLTNALMGKDALSVDELIEFALREGFDSLELGPSFPATAEAIEKVRNAGLSISSLIYCRDMLSSDEEVARHHLKELTHRIDLAAEFGIPGVTATTGYASNPEGEKPNDSYESLRPLPIRSLDPFVKLFDPIISNAEKRGVWIGLEICPLMGNFALSPPIWERIFERLDSPRFGLTFDPSHLIWQFIDPYEALEHWFPRVLHVHAKDTEIRRDILRSTGILTDFSWWRFRIPGWGEIDWKRMISILLEHGYDGVISIEHEDPVFDGTIDRVKQGLHLSMTFLSGLFG